MRPTRTLIPAAVLVGLVERPEGMRVLFTKRTPHLTFEYDPTVERGVRITKLIDDLVDGPPPDDRPD